MITILQSCIGIALTYHRMLTHRSFKVPRAIEYTFAYIGTLAVQGEAAGWSLGCFTTGSDTWSMPPEVEAHSNFMHQYGHGTVVPLRHSIHANVLQVVTSAYGLVARISH